MAHRDRYLCLLLAVFSATAAAQSESFAHDDLLAVLATFGMPAQPSGLTTVNLWLGGGGGHVTLPPLALNNSLCSSDRLHFVGTGDTAYTAETRSRFYWVQEPDGGCGSSTPTGIPARRIAVRDSVPAGIIVDLVSRTEELIALARDYPVCEQSRYFERMMAEEPLSIRAFWMDEHPHTPQTRADKSSSD